MEKSKIFDIENCIDIFMYLSLGIKFKRNIDEIFSPAGIGSDEFEIEEIGEAADFSYYLVFKIFNKVN